MEDSDRDRKREKNTNNNKKKTVHKRCTYKKYIEKKYAR